MAHPAAWLPIIGFSKSCFGLRFNYCCPFIQSAHCVGHGVIVSPDGTTQCLELVWKYSSAFFKLRYLLFLTLKYPYPVLNLTCFSRKVVRWYDQLSPATSLLPKFNSFANSVVLELACRLWLPGFPTFRRKDLTACSAEASLPPRVLRDFWTRQSRPSLIAW